MIVAVVIAVGAISVAAIAHAPGGPDSAATSGSIQAPHADASATADAAVDQLVAGRPPDSVSIAAENLTTSKSYRHGGKTLIHTASVVKLDILETLLLQRQDAGQALSDTETAQATAMTENSDNDAATQLWNDVGGADGIREADSRLGAPNTHPDEDGYWGLTTTDADDQLNLLRDLVTPGPLTPASQSFALELMRQVEGDQAWGASAIADPRTTPALKDGWLPLDEDNGRWAIGSVGVLAVHGQQVVVAVLTQHNDTQPGGIELAESLAHAVAPAITPPAN